MISKDFRKVLPYALVVFLGYVGFSMPLPLLPEMFLDPQKGILSLGFSEKTKTFLLGLMMSAYPFGQLIGSPILGKYSDIWGRKKVILFSLIGCFVGYIAVAFAIQYTCIMAIFFGLFFCGLCEGNIAIAQSVVADLALPEETEKKTIYFGWLNLFVCVAFIIGPILGGQFSSISMGAISSFSIPFWLASFLTLIGMAIVLHFSEETRSLAEQKNIVQMGYWNSFKQGMLQPSLGKMYLVNFFLALGYFSYFRFFPIYLQNAFSFSSSLIGYVIAYGSVAFALSAFAFLKPISRRMSAEKAVAFFSILLALSFFLVLRSGNAFNVWITTLPVNICLAVVMTYASVLVSNASSSSFQGQALGILTSVQVTAEALTGVMGGWVAGYFVSLPITIGALMLCIASVFLFAFPPKKTDHSL